MPLAVTDREGGCELPVRVIPRAGRTGVVGVRDRSLLIRLAAAPVDGAANEALVALLAELFDRPTRSFTIVSGRSGRDKRVRVEGLSARDAASKLSAILPA